MIYCMRNDLKVSLCYCLFYEKKRKKTLGIHIFLKSSGGVIVQARELHLSTPTNSYSKKYTLCTLLKK